MKEEVFELVPSLNLRSYYGIKLIQDIVGNSYFDLLDNPGSIISEKYSMSKRKKSFCYIDTLNHKLWNDNYDDHPVGCEKFDT